MAETTNDIIIDFSGLKDWTPYEGIGANDLLTADGVFSGKLTKVLVEVSDKNKTAMLTCALDVLDDDNKGRHLVRNVLCAGSDKNGDPQIRQLGDLLYSIGYKREDIITKVAGLGKASLRALADQYIVNQTAYFEADAREYQGKVTSNVKNFIEKSKFDTAKANGAWRRPHVISQGGAPSTAAAVPLAGSVAPMGTPGGLQAVGAATAPAAAKGVDPLSQLGGLSLGVN